MVRRTEPRRGRPVARRGVCRTLAKSSPPKLAAKVVLVEVALGRCRRRRATDEVPAY